MTAPNMAAITASLERSFQNCSLNHHHHHAAPPSATERSDEASDHPHSSSSDAAVELNSHVSLPYHWEQCLDLKTGEIYYINWRNGMRANEDPRLTQEYMNNGDYYYSDDDEDDDGEDEDEDGSSSYDSEESSSESSPTNSSRDHHYGNNSSSSSKVEKDNNVLVVAGCKRCLMYFMVPKQVEDCPKCCGHLLHFDRSDSSSSNGSP